MLGGSNNDEAAGLAVADDGTVFIGGVTQSTNFPGLRAARFGAGGPPDGFISQLRPGDPRSLKTVLLGGKNVDHISGLALDKSGNLFASGYTSSADFPLKNAVQPRFGGAMDAFLIKLRVSDWSLLFSTYLGGAKMDGAYGMSLDSSGNPIVSGVTESTDFPATPSAFQPRLRGLIDAFVTKLSADGTRILWSTYYGGSKANSDQFLGGSVAVDEGGRVWLSGMTNSPDLPTRNPSQASYGGGDFDGFLAAFSSDGAKLCYGSFIGGRGHDILEGLAAGSGKVYASGLSSSDNLRQSRSQIQSGYGGGPYDAIIFGLSVPTRGSCR
ncbi:MAG: SBBP repeat-containing protein [Bryobacteraceae bacterium]